MNEMKSVLVSVLLFVLVLMQACSSDDDVTMVTNDDDDDEVQLPDDNRADNDPVFNGFDFSIQTGDFWEYYWITEDLNVASGSPSSDASNNGNFRITIGDPVTIDEKEAYKLEITGQNLESFPGPRWAFLAIDNNQLLGSIDGNSLETIFNAQNGEWLGGGFFASFDNDATIVTSNVTVENEFIRAENSIVASYQDGQTICEVIAGQRVCANDNSFSISVADFFKSGIGPIGYNYSSRVFNQGGGFTTSSEFYFQIGLVATSFVADDGFIPSLPPWLEKTSLPEPFLLTPVASWDDRLFFFGGIDTMDVASRQIHIYDPATNEWSNGGETPRDLAFRYEFNSFGDTRIASYSAFVIGPKIYFVRTRGPSTDHILIYDPNGNSWEPGPDLIGQIRGTSCYYALLNDSILFFPRIANRQGQVWHLNTSTNTWSVGNPSPWPHLDRSSVTGLGDKVYFSGTFRSGSFESRVRQYDLTVPLGQSGAWSDITFFGEGRADVQSQILNDHLYVFGGDNFGPTIRSVEKYNIATNTWVKVGSMITARRNFSSVVVNNKIYAIGGENGSKRLFTIEEYDPLRDFRTQ